MANLLTNNWNTNRQTSTIRISTSSTAVDFNMGTALTKEMACAKAYIPINTSKYSSVTLTYTAASDGISSLSFGIFNYITAEYYFNSDYDHGISSNSLSVIDKIYTIKKTNTPSSITINIPEGTTGTKYVGFLFYGNTHTLNENVGWSVRQVVSITSLTATEKAYKVTYKPGSYTTGSTYTDSAEIGSKITLRGATYTRNGYTQTGWSTVATGTTKDYNLSTEYLLSDGTVLYPYWEYNYVTVSYNANGGTGTTNSQSVIKGNNVTLKANGFTAPSASSPVHAIYLKTENGGNSVNGTATCYENKFYSWGLNSATGTSYQPGASYGPVNSNTVFYAKWSTNYQLGSSTKSSTESWGYQVIFDAATNGGSCSTAVLNSKIYTHYDFAGWLNSDKTKTYPVGTKLGGPAAYTYYESWTPRTENGSIKLPAATKTYPSSTSTTIYFNANGGTCNVTSMQSSATLTYNFDGWYNGNTRVGGTNNNFAPNKATTLIARFITITSPFNEITLPTPIRTGYKFLGWSINKNTTSGTIGQYTPSGGETLYAIWQPYTYTIEYQKNNGTGSMSKSTHTYDTSQKLTRNTFTRVGYEFLGWSQNSKDKNPTYYDQQEIINLTTTNNDNIILYAIWKPKGTVRISIDGNMTKKAQAYIFHDGTWHLTQPQTNYNNNWKINGG